MTRFICAAAIGLLLALPARAPLSASDWPQWGGGPGRNMVSPETGLPDSFDPGKMKPRTEEVDLSTTRNVKWVAKLGSQAYGNPTVSGGRVFVGTNNQSPRDPRHRGDRGVLMCLDAATGALAWQLVVPKLGTGKVSDWEYLGICSSPAVEGDRVYVVTNRCEVVCLDTKGLSDGNQGLSSEPTCISTDGKPVTPSPTDADVIWRFDMRTELGVFPHNIASSGALILGDRLVVDTSNGQDWTHVHIPNPRAPILAMLDKRTGELVGEEASSISQRIFHGSWSTPSGGTVAGKGQIFFGGPDGWLYGFDAAPVKDAQGNALLKELWRCDANPPEHRTRGGLPIKYPDRNGPSEIIATPVFHEGKVYAAVGQDPEHGMGVGTLCCVDPGGSGDVTRTHLKWQYKIDRSMSTVAVKDGLLFTADFTGWVYCFDAATGKLNWKHDTESNIWGSPLVADGKVYIGNESGKLLVFAAAKEMKLISSIDMGTSIYSTPVAADGVLYVGTQTHLYAVARPVAPTAR